MADKLVATILDAFDRPVAFHRCFVALTGSVHAALLLSQAVYWTNVQIRSGKPGWFYKSNTEWERETGLTRREQATAREHLQKTKFWQEKLKGVPATLHYRIDPDEFEKALNQLHKNAQPVAQKRSTGLRGSVQPVAQKRTTINRTETTSEITAESSSVCVAVAPPAGADTHTALSSPSKKKKKTSPVAEEFPPLTEEQSITYQILTAYFPSLGTRANRVEFAKFLQTPEGKFSPGAAGMLCAWLSVNGRGFKFMRLSLFQQLRDEFAAQLEGDLGAANQYFWHAHGEKWDRIRELFRGWRHEHGNGNGVAAATVQKKLEYCGGCTDGYMIVAVANGGTAAKPCGCVKAQKSGKENDTHYADGRAKPAEVVCR